MNSATNNISSKNSSIISLPSLLMVLTQSVARGRKVRAPPPLSLSQNPVIHRNMHKSDEPTPDLRRSDDPLSDLCPSSHSMSIAPGRPCHAARASPLRTAGPPNLAQHAHMARSSALAWHGRVTRHARWLSRGTVANPRATRLQPPVKHAHRPLRNGPVATAWQARNSHAGDAPIPARHEQPDRATDSHRLLDLCATFLASGQPKCVVVGPCGLLAYRSIALAGGLSGHACLPWATELY